MVIARGSFSEVLPWREEHIEMEVIIQVLSINYNSCTRRGVIW